MCIGCHGIPGYQASFPRSQGADDLRPGAKYIVGALTAYKKGERKHPTMRAIAGSLSDQDMADLGAFYEVHGGPAAPTGDRRRRTRREGGRSCSEGRLRLLPRREPEQADRPSYPKLAGQHGDYLPFRAQGLPDRQQCAGQAAATRSWPGMAKPFSHAELKQLAGYLATVAGRPPDRAGVALPLTRASHLARESRWFPAVFCADFSWPLKSSPAGR